MNELLPSLLVIGTTKNSGKSLIKNINRIMRIKNRFKDFNIFLFENNSNDNTKEILYKIKQKYNCFDYESKDFSENELARIAKARHLETGVPCRIEILAYVRNLLKDIVKTKYPEKQYILSFDFDVTFFNPYDIVKLLQKYQGKFDCITANGLTKTLRYRDAFAFRDKIHPWGPELFDEFWWNTIIKRIQQRFFGSKLIPVYSAFGGAALFPSSVYFSSDYCAIPNQLYFEIENKICSNLSNSDEKIEYCKNNVNDQGIVFPKPKPNTNYNLPIICEHVIFNFGLIQKNYKRIFISPTWRMLFI